MAPHASKRRKFGHNTSDTASSNRSEMWNVANGSAHDRESVTSDDDGVPTGGTGPSVVSKGSEKEVSRTESQHGPLSANEMYRSSMITLQVRDLVEEVRPNYASLRAGAEPILRKLKANIEGFPPRGPLTVRRRLRSKCVHSTNLSEFAGRGG